jgi:hypothetical protein
MRRTLWFKFAAPFLVFCGGYTLAQQQSLKKPNASPELAQAKPLSVAEIHDVARRVSVLIAERNEQTPDGTRHVGSGVWLAEGYVATCWHVIKDLKGPIKISLGAGDVVTEGNDVFEGIYMDYAATVVTSDPAADITILAL